MAKTINDIATGLRVPSQVSLNPKQEAVSENALKNLGLNNTLAYTYYHGMTVFCIAEESTWVWRKPKAGEIGLLTAAFVYPLGRIVDDINYGGQAYNFFKVITTQDIKSILNTLDLNLEWKKGDDYFAKPNNQLPSLVTDSVYSRRGYIGSLDPGVQSNLIVHPAFLVDGDTIPCKLLEANILNLAVYIKDYSRISAYSPKLVISKYTYSKRRADSTRIGETNLKRVRKGSFKVNTVPNLIRPNYIPLSGKYQVIDFGQEHYFRTDPIFAQGGYFPTPNTDMPTLLYTRGNGSRYSQTKFDSVNETLDFRAFVYLEFQIELTIDTKKYLSHSLERIKMFVTTKMAVGATPDLYDVPYPVRIRYKHT